MQTLLFSDFGTFAGKRSERVVVRKAGVDEEEFPLVRVKLLLGSEVFSGREHRGATDAANAMLNYGYGILYSKLWAALLVDFLVSAVTSCHFSAK